MTLGSVILDPQDVTTLLQNQLVYEIYAKQQLVQRLGAVLRESVMAGGAEAERQNLVSPFARK